MPSRRAALLLPLLAAGCGGGPVRTSFPPLSYDYLTKLTLNVAAVTVGEPPPPGPLEVQAPIPPGPALQQMARERLAAGGSGGQAVFVIDLARIARSGRTLEGALAAHLDILTSDGERAAYAEARVARTLSAGDDLRGGLYDLVKLMLDDMNVELEFQIRRSLRDWLQVPGTAPAPAPVERQDLQAPAT